MTAIHPASSRRLPAFLHEDRPVRRALRVLPALIVVFGCLAMGMLHINAYPKLGPIDEQAHVDYIYKVRNGHIPRQNELMGQDALHEESCRGFDSPYVPPPCVKKGMYDPRTFQFGGASAAAGHPPVYYALTAIVATPLQYVPGVGNFIDAARLATTLWLAAALIVLMSVLRSYGVRWTAVAGVLGMAAVPPQVVHSSVTVNPDSTAMLSGSLVLWVVLRHRRPFPLAFVGAFVVLLKATNILAVAMGILFLLMAMFWSEREAHASRLRRLWDIVAPAFWLAIGALVATIGWLIVFKIRTLPEPTDAQAILGATADIYTVGTAFVTPFRGGAMPLFFFQSKLVAICVEFVSFLLVAGAAAATLTSPMRTRLGQIGLATMAALLVGPALIMLLIGLGAGQYFSPPSRYGLSLVPWAFAALAFSATTKTSRVGLLTFAAIFVAAIFKALIAWV